MGFLRVYLKTTKADNGRGLLINADHIDTIEPTNWGVRIVFDNSESVETQADFSKLQNMLATVVIPDGCFPD